MQGILPVIFAIVLCFSLQDVLNSGCLALCKRDGYDSGMSLKGECICGENKGKLDDFIHRRVLLPHGAEDEPPPKTYYLKSEHD